MEKNNKILGLIVMIITVALVLVSCRPVNLVEQLNKQLIAKSILDTVHKCPGCRFVYLAEIGYGNGSGQYMMANQDKASQYGCGCSSFGEIVKEYKSANRDEKFQVLSSHGLNQEEFFYLWEFVFPDAEKCSDDNRRVAIQINCGSRIEEYLNGEIGLSSVSEACPCDLMYPWDGWLLGDLDSVKITRVLTQICDPPAVAPSVFDSSKFRMTSLGCFQENPSSGAVYFYQLYTMNGNMIQSGNFSNELCVVKPNSSGIYYLRIYNNRGFSETKKILFN